MSENNNAHYARELARSLEKWAHRIQNSASPRAVGLLEPDNVAAAALGAVAELRQAATEIDGLESLLAKERLKTEQLLDNLAKGLDHLWTRRADSNE